MKSKQSLALVLTDTHLHKNNYELVRDIFKQAIEVCKEKNIKNIFHLGDFFTSREAQPLHVLDEAQEIVEMVVSNGIFFTIIPGNHDKVDLESQKSYVSVAFKKQEKCLVLDEEVNILFDDLNVIWLPYFKERGTYQQRLNEASKMIRRDKKNILLTHISVNGVKNNDGSEVENNLDLNLFKNFHSVLTGHYHQQQDASNVYYIGSAYQANYGEDEIKGFTLLYKDGSHEFIKSKFPEFKKVKIDIDDKVELEAYEKLKIKNNDHIRVILVGDKTKLQAYNKQKLQDKGIDVKFESEDINTNVDISKNEIIIFNRSNIKDAYDKFCELNSIEDKEFGEKYLEHIL